MCSKFLCPLYSCVSLKTVIGLVGRGMFYYRKKTLLPKAFATFFGRERASPREEQKSLDSIELLFFLFCFPLSLCDDKFYLKRQHKVFTHVSSCFAVVGSKMWNRNVYPAVISEQKNRLLTLSLSFSPCFKSLLPPSSRRKFRDFCLVVLLVKFLRLLAWETSEVFFSFLSDF